MNQCFFEMLKYRDNDAAYFKIDHVLSSNRAEKWHDCYKVIPNTKRSQISTFRSKTSSIRLSVFDTGDQDGMFSGSTISLMLLT